jgi:predicted alpha/beta superfamily hydrolase
MSHFSRLTVFRCFLAVGLVLTSFSRNSSAQVNPLVIDTNPPVALQVGKKFKMRSTILNEEREYWVHLPATYDQTLGQPKKYPVLYLLDGSTHFFYASGLIQFLAFRNYQIPEIILVGVRNTNRDRDMTPTRNTKGHDGLEAPWLLKSGGSTNFHRFLAEELVAQIESQYRAAPYRILVGHSLAGLFTLDAFVQRSEKFNAFIAIDPTLSWDNEIMLKRVREMAPKSNAFAGALYISSAPLGPGEERVDIRTFAEVVKSHAGPFFRSKYDYFSGEHHGTVPLLSLYYGLLFFFEGYPTHELSEKDLENAARLKEHFATLSRRVGHEFLPPEDLIDELGGGLLNFDKKPEEALKMFLLNVENYPGSSKAYGRLAEAYAVKGQTQLAIENCERSLKLNPNNDASRTLLTKLKEGKESSKGVVDK